MSIKVSIPRRLVTGYKIRACRAFPAEFFGFALGRRDGDSYEISEFWYPPNWRDHCKEGEVDGNEAWWRDAVEYASTKKLMPIGSVHTHCYLKGAQEFDEVQSLGDLEAWEELDRISGVMNVVEKDSGKKKAGEIHWFGPTVAVEVTIK